MNKILLLLPIVLLMSACAANTTPQASVVPDQTAMPVDQKPSRSPTANLKTFTHKPKSNEGLQKAFTVKYPESWTVTSNSDATTGSATVQITNETYTISMVQGILDGGYCLYPSDADQQGMFNRYGNYTEISKQAGKKWRVAPLQATDSDPVAYEVCQSDRGIDGFYGNVTEIGPISIRGIKRGESLPAEVAQILSDITF